MHVHAQEWTWACARFYKITFSFSSFISFYLFFSFSFSFQSLLLCFSFILYFLCLPFSFDPTIVIKLTRRKLDHWKTAGERQEKESEGCALVSVEPAEGQALVSVHRGDWNTTGSPGPASVFREDTVNFKAFWYQL